MNKIISITFLIASLSLSVSNAHATCTMERSGWGECFSSEIVTTGIPTSCGEGCTYTYNNGTLTIVADNANYENPKINNKFFAKSYRENDTFTDENGDPITIENVVIDGELHIGQDAFHYLDANISGKDGTLILNNTSWNAFVRNTLSGNVIWNGKSFGGFNYATINGNLIIEDTAKVTGSQGTFQLGPSGKIFCKTDMGKCLNLLSATGVSEEIISVAQAYPKGCDALALSGDCAKCSGNYTSIGGICIPRRYTPAEIAELVGESNTIYLFYK